MDKSTINAERFLGFADIYESARPKLPAYAIEAIAKYLGRTPSLVIDLGCGTGLSTAVWNGHCERVIGIEPSCDMLSVARQKENDVVSFKKAYAHETGLKEGSADVVICSQSFHWMNPDLTLSEVNRILKEGGVFATVDCDWPPFCSWQAETAYMALHEKARRIEESHPQIKDSFCRWDKNSHLDNIKSSGYFRYCREIVFSSREAGSAKRFTALALSQGGLQSILKTEPELILSDIERLSRTVDGIFGEAGFDMDFSYRMRIGIK